MLFLLTLAAALQAAPAGQAQAVPVTPPEAQLRPTDFSAEPVALMIAGFDTDRDARVTRAELDAGVAASFGGEGDTMSLIDLGRWSVRWLGHQGALPGRFDFDTDEDDRISRAEYAAELTRNFDRLDTDRNGVLDRSELVRIRVQQLAPVRPGRRRG